MCDRKIRGETPGDNPPEDGEEADPPRRGEWAHVAGLAVVGIVMVVSIAVTGHPESVVLIGTAFSPMLR